MKLDRAPVRFVLTDCFKMAVAVGAGLTCGFCIAIGAILGIGRVVAWIAAKVLS